MTCKYKVKIKDIQYNYKVQMTDIQSKYKFKVFCTGYDDSEIKDKIDAMYEAWPKASGEGETITLNDTANTTMAIDLKGNTSQEGTPTPEAPQDIHVVSGNNTIKVEGKNLFDKNNINGLNAYLDTTNNKLVSNNNNKSIYISCKPNTTYTISKTPSKRFGTAYTYTTPANNTAIYGTITNYDGASITITTDTNAQYLVVWLINSNISGEIPYQTAIDTLQIEYGNQATTYVPYQTPQTYPINLGDIELCKIGDYQDSIVKDNGKWYLNKQIGKVILNGSESWAISGKTYYINISTKRKLTSSSSNGLISNYFKDTTATSSANVGLGEMFEFFNPSVPNNNVGFNYDNAVGGTSTFKTWLSSNNVEVRYVLATPTTTEITDSTLISQLEAIKEAESYLGQTNISQVNNDKPFIITTKALIDLSNLGTSTTNTLSTTNINRLETTSIRSSISPDNLEVNNSEETPEEE